MSEPVSTLVTYWPKKGKESDLEELVQLHAPALRASGLITSEPVRVWAASDKRTGGTYFIESFEWKDDEASAIAHQTPEVMAVWEPMGAVLEDMSIAKLTPLNLAG